MERIQLHNDIKALSDFRANMTAYIDQIHRTNRPMVITQNGKSAAVVLNVDAYEAMIEKMELLEDIHRAEKELDEGLGLSHEAAKRQAIRSLKR